MERSARDEVDVWLAGNSSMTDCMPCRVEILDNDDGKGKEREWGDTRAHQVSSQNVTQSGDASA